MTWRAALVLSPLTDQHAQRVTAVMALTSLRADIVEHDPRLELLTP